MTTGVGGLGGGVRDKGREKERGGKGNNERGGKKTDYSLSFRLSTSAFKRSDDSQLQSKTET